VRGLISKVRRGRFDSAFRAYRDAVVFPGVVSGSCPAYCEDACVRSRHDGAVDLRLIESGVASRGRPESGRRYAIPAKDGRVAVVGAGFGGLAFAYRMASKGYEVTIFEREARAGGRLREMLSDEIVDADIDAAFSGLKYELVTGVCVDDLEDIARGRDAVYVSTGPGGEDFGLSGGHDARLLTTGVRGVFLGGGVRGSDPMHAIEDGLRAAASAEEYMKTGRSEGYGAAFEERVVNEKYYDIEYGFDADAADVQDGDAQDGDACVREALRCPMCNCSLCMDACELIQSYGTNPKRIANDLSLTVLPVEDKIKRVASRMLNSCNLCGVCDAVCPAGVETCRAMYESRRIMGETGHIPPAFHDFWIEDLRFTMSDAAHAVIGPEGGGSADILFFPGCQLAASSPDVVRGAFEHIRSVNPRSALMLSCCGVPAEWAEEAELLESVIAKYREAWRELGEPLTLFACSSCRDSFARRVPEAKGTSLYEWLLANGDGLAANGARGGGSAYVFDPCAAIGDEALRLAVRSLAGLAGVEVENGGAESADAACCGFGGHIYPANPGLTERIVRERVSRSASPYITYCANCRDLFLYTGKDCRHILDIYFGAGGAPALPSLTQRRENRRALKASYLPCASRGGEPHDQEGAAAPDGFSVEIPDGLEEKMDRMLLLRSDAAAAILHCEESGDKFVDGENGRFVGLHRNRTVTVWVEYEMASPARAVLYNIYAHRMEILR
jgi:Fe-S oxidoreductase